jgi:hypothetical protein
MPAEERLHQSATLTDAAGHFEFHGLKAGSYNYNVIKYGFAYQNNNEVTLGASQELLVIHLNPLAIIHGNVIDSDGEAMPGVSVRALHSEIQDGRRITRQDRQVTTDDQGEYRMWNFQPGDYYIVAAGRSGGTAVVVGPTPPGGLAHEGFDPVYFPSARDRASATAIALAPGQEFQADLKIQMQPAYRVRGMLRNVTPYQTVTVELARSAGEVGSNRVVVNASTGRFEANDVVPGTYVLRAVQKAGELELRGEREIRVESANLDGVVVELMPGLTVSGVVRAPAMFEANPVNFAGRRMGRQVMLMPEGSINLGASYHAVVDEQGKFTIENVPAGRYRLQVTGFGTYLASAVSGSKDILAEGLVMGRAWRRSPWRLRFVTTGALWK